jgi:hypothetical protein
MLAIPNSGESYFYTKGTLMPKRTRMLIASSMALVLTIVSMFAVSIASANVRTPASATAKSATSAHRTVSHMISMHVVNMQNVPTAKANASHTKNGTMPFLTGVSGTTYAQRKAAAAHSANAPVDTQAIASVNMPAKVKTPPTKAKFNGMADSGTICNYFGTGCQPPDQALATSSSWVFQGVNTSWAVYSPSGTIQSGWPKNSQNFFGVPNPGSCDPNGPFLSDPRAFYDPVDNRFWAATLQAEGALGLNNCPEQTIYWEAVSQTNNPNGKWNVYAFNMQISSGKGACATCAADYTEFGFDQSAIYYSANMFNQQGTAYVYAETFSVSKSAMESGSSVTAYGFYGLQANGVYVDTVQPVENQAKTGPGVGLLVDAFNMNGDGSADCFSTACSGIIVWAVNNPGTQTASLSGTVIATKKTYISPPNADDPGCSGCIETLDTRISGTPIYQKNNITFALETGLNNGKQVVPSIYWGQIKPTISSGVVTGGSITQDGYVHFGGDQTASFGAVMVTPKGNILMVFDTMSSTIDPSILYATRTTKTAKGKFLAAKYLFKATTPTNNSRWGDYEATSYTGVSSNETWFSAQYSGSNADWATYIGEVKF